MQESYIIWSGVCTSVLIITILVSPEERRAVRANWFLAALIFFLSLRLSVRFLFRSGYIESSGPLTMVGLSADLLVGPCLYFYVLFLTRSEKTRGRLAWVHWIPGTTSLLLSIWTSIPTQEGATSYLDIRSQAPDLGFTIWHLPYIASILFYSLASLSVLQRHGEQIREQFSDLNQINLMWLRWLCGILAVASLSLLIQSPEGMSNAMWQSVTYVLLIYYIGFMGVRQPAIFQQEAARQKLPVLDQLPQPVRSVDAKLPLNSDELWDALQLALEKDQPYRRPNLNLARLAEILQIPPYQLSAVINHHGKCSFFDLINGRRVENAKTLLLDESCTLNILDIGLESGFNSKSTFYHQFKKATGKTPSEFRIGR